MTITHSPVRRCAVYRGNGDVADESLIDVAESAGDSINHILSRELICARADLRIGPILTLMLKHHIGCLPVVDERRWPIGMITKLDLIEQLDAAMRCPGGGAAMPTDLVAQTADDVMMPIALTLSTNATITHAAAMMMSEDMHHVLVIEPSRALVGVVSSKDIVAWVDDHARAQINAAASR